MFSDRVRFNWGYHDARHERDRGRARVVVEDGPQTSSTLRSVGQVSKSFDRFYAEGYAMGLMSEEAETRSTDAWRQWSGRPE